MTISTFSALNSRIIWRNGKYLYKVDLYHLLTVSYIKMNVLKRFFPADLLEVDPFFALDFVLGFRKNPCFLSAFTAALTQKRAR